MADDNLRELLGQLRDRLAQARSIDQDSRALLSNVVRDIERTLSQGGKDAVAQAAQSAPRLEAVAVQLETEHPALAQVLRQFVSLLASAGI